MTDFAAWDSFYMIVASAAGALIGLQFVVITLIADRPPPRMSEGSAAFATPTVVHFSTVLLLAALVRMPWSGVIGPCALLTVVGAAGVAYVGVVYRRMRGQNVYEPVWEDWIFHAILPFAAYGLLAMSALAFRGHLHGGLFGVGASSLILLFVGIHNAWDTAAYHVLTRRGE